VLAKIRKRRAALVADSQSERPPDSSAVQRFRSMPTARMRLDSFLKFAPGMAGMPSRDRIASV